ncbi:protein STRUBBELIG-RECEPTOR FAMILY 8-like [Brassica napus]|uniref:protein STRUBBELIG-RECEPTOR FAMILY 8-like n=1 Tax=Brassica napus TaxID=3708 RepID=UPI0020793BB2|nr:protein STRUBBELIG-RECEPTOR FAMILY 8-like [Brassica napus]
MATGDRAMFPVLLLIFSSISGFSVVNCVTDPSDVQALQVLYTSLNSPSQLTNWKNGGGDPCGESWKGITCERSAVVSIDISDSGVSGTLGYLLSDLMSLRNWMLAETASMTHFHINCHRISQACTDSL